MSGSGCSDDTGNKLSSFTVTAPGRLCLFGEHQDYLHLPVIAMALPLQCRIRVQPTTTTRSRLLVIRVPALRQVWEYDLHNLPPRQGGQASTATIDPNFQPDFALAAIYEALDDGWVFGSGAECESTTDIPMQAGCSSSSAFCVAWSLVLAQLCGQATPLLQDPLVLAQRAHRAEVTHFGAPGGTMDHVTSALGGLIRIGAAGAANVKNDPWSVQRFHYQSTMGCWVLADSGQPKDTFGHLHRCKGARLALLEKLGGTWDCSGDNATATLTDDEKVLWSATLTNRDTEVQAAQAMSLARSTAADKLGPLMLKHHEALRDGLHLSTPKLEAMREAASAAGAMGFKVVGSGGGGCGVAWTQDPKQATAVAQALQTAGAPQTWIIQAPSPGANLVVDKE